MKKKTDASYLKALEQRLLETEKENRFLRLKAEAFETAIQIAEEQFNIPILKKSGTKQPKSWPVATRSRVWNSWLNCRVGGPIGLSRQAWYAAARRRERKCFEQDLILGEVRRIRRQIPGIGTAKLHDLMKDFVCGHQIKLGRDKLHKLLKDNNRLSDAQPGASTLRPAPTKMVSV